MRLGPVGAALLVAAFVAPASLAAADPIPTTLTLEQVPGYVYYGDSVTIIATVSPAPDGGTVQVRYGHGTAESIVSGPVDSATGRAELTFTPNPASLSDLVWGWFRGTPGYLESDERLLIDLRPLPVASFTATPDASTRETSATFEWIVAPGVRTDCQFNSLSWSPCTSPVSLTSLAERRHAFSVRSIVEADGRVGRTATHEWAVDRTGPVPGVFVLDGGRPTTNQTTLTAEYGGAVDELSDIAFVRLSWTGDVDGDGRLLDNSPTNTRTLQRRWVDGPSTRVFPDPMLGSGPQTIWVQWFDAAGNHSALRSATIDLRVMDLIVAQGAWQTDSATVSIELAGVAPSEVRAVRMSNHSVWDFENERFAYQREYATVPDDWDLVDPVSGGSSAEGMRVVQAQWRDAQGRWSDGLIRAIDYDTTPEPDLVLGDGDGVSGSMQVPVSLGVPMPGFPWHLGVEHSCDLVEWNGGHWEGHGNVTYEVSLDDAQAGCPTGLGDRSVAFRWLVYPGAGPSVTSAIRWSASSRMAAQAVVADQAAPVATAPIQRFTPGTALASGKVPVRLVWSGSDATSGVARYELRQRIGSGTWTTVNANLTRPSATLNLTPGHNYRYAVRAFDRAGNVGPYAYGPTFSLTGLSEASSANRYSGTWGTASATGYWGGRVRYATSSSARATFTFTGRSVGLVTTMAPSRGKASIYVNGAYAATLDLGSATWRNGVLAWSQAWSTSARRTVEVRVLGTAGRPRVDLDGWVVGS